MNKLFKAGKLLLTNIFCLPQSLLLIFKALLMKIKAAIGLMMRKGNESNTETEKCTLRSPLF